MENKKVDDRDQECCEEVPIEINNPSVEMYRDLMLKCFDAASVVIEKAELLPAVSEFAPVGSQVEVPAGMRIRIALPIFDRVTRQMPVQDRMYTLALRYVGFLIHEKEAEAKRSEEARATMTPPGFFMAAVPPCRHEGLWTLREALMCEDHLSPDGYAVLDALTIKRPAPEGIDTIICPNCLARVDADMVKSGHLWREPREQKHGKPEGPSASDTPLFEFELHDVEANGHSVIDIMKRSATVPDTGVGHEDKVEAMEVADVLADPDFLETIRKKHGDGVYIVKLWKHDLTLHSDHEFLLQSDQGQEAPDDA